MALSPQYEWKQVTLDANPVTGAHNAVMFFLIWWHQIVLLQQAVMNLYDACE